MKSGEPGPDRGRWVAATSFPAPPAVVRSGHGRAPHPRTGRQGPRRRPAHARLALPSEGEGGADVAPGRSPRGSDRRRLRRLAPRLRRVALPELQGRGRPAAHGEVTGRVVCWGCIPPRG